MKKYGVSIVVFGVLVCVVIMLLTLVSKQFNENKKNWRINNLIAMAEKGNKEAQNDLGFSYGQGLGVDKNYEQAIYWYEKAAAQGSIPALYNIGLFYEKGFGVTKDLLQARRFYTKAAMQGSADAQVNLGFLYMSGQGGGVDYVKARRFFLMAADKKYGCFI